MSKGPWWLAQRFADQVDRMSTLLAACEPNWNIDGGTSANGESLA